MAPSPLRLRSRTVDIEEPSSESPAGELPRKGRGWARELTALIGLPILIWIVGWGQPLVFVVFMALVGAVALWEFLSFGAAKGYVVHKVASELLLLMILVTFVDDRISVETGIYAVLLVIPAIWLFSRADLETALPGTAVTTLATLYVGMTVGALIRTRLDFPVGPELIFFLFASVWAGDTAAYYTGRTFGKTRLIPKVSPKKTVEGLVGGLAGSVVGAAVAQATFFPEIPMIHALICGALLALVGVVGDLVESAWKRSAAVKDSGGLLPGHGGILDRVDSLLFAAPVLYTYWALLSGTERILG